MFEEFRPVTIFVAILTGVVITSEVIFSLYDIDNYRLKRTDFDVRIYNFDSDENPTLIIKGNRKMSWGEYAISFELYNKSNVMLKDRNGESHREWLIEYFCKDGSRNRYYEITNCPAGQHVMKVQVAKGFFSKTYYLPFEVNAN